MSIGPIYTWMLDRKERREQQANESRWASATAWLYEDYVVKPDKSERIEKVESQLDIGAGKRIELVSTKEQVYSKSTGKKERVVLFTVELRRCTGKGKKPTLWCEESYQSEEESGYAPNYSEFSMPHDFQLEKSGSSAVLVAFVDDWMLRFVEVDLTRKGVFYYLTSVIKRPRTRKPVREGVNLSEFVERRHGGFGGKPTISIKSLQWEGERLHVKLEISRLDIEREIYHLRRSNSGDWEDLSASLEQHHK